MTLDQLQTLSEIVKTGSFRQASLNLHKAQSAISYAIKQLEGELGFELFDRSEYRPQLTERGKRFVSRSQSFLSDFDTLSNFAKVLGTDIEPEVKLSISVLFPLHLIIPVFKKFGEQYPETQLTVFSNILDGESDVISNEADIAINESSLSTQKLIEEKILDLDVIYVCHRSHPLAQLERAPKTEELKKHTQIVLSQKRPTDRTAGVLNPSLTWNVSEFSSKKELLLAGLGWGGMPMHLIADELKNNKLVPLMREPSKIELRVVRAKSDLGPAASFLWNALIKCSEN